MFSPILTGCVCTKATCELGYCIRHGEERRQHSARWWLQSSIFFCKAFK